MSKSRIERLSAGRYAVKGRDTYIFRSAWGLWIVTYDAWGGGRGTSSFKAFRDAKRFALGED